MIHKRLDKYELPYCRIVCLADGGHMCDVRFVLWYFNFLLCDHCHDHSFFLT